MGKRKYESVKDDQSKKTDTQDAGTYDESEETELPTTQPSSEIRPKKQKNHGGFDVKHFRKELAAKQGQNMILTQFLQVCQNPDQDFDYLLEYLKIGGNSHEILRQVSQDHKKNLSVATPAFHLFHLIILKVQSSLPHMIAITEEACRYFLNNFMSTIEIMISENSGPRHRKIVLNLFTSMVTLNPDLGIEVLSHAPLTPKHLVHITARPNYKEKDSVRTSFVHFMTSFLVDGHLPLIKALLEKTGLLALVIPGLGHDDAEAVMMFLNILKNNVINNPLISKSLKLKTFNHNVLLNLFRLFTWKGPPDIINTEKYQLRTEIMSLLSDILRILFTSHKLGLFFTDSSLGIADTNRNQVLFKALFHLRKPWEIDDERKIILEIVHDCPHFHRAIVNVIEQSFEPQHSPAWLKATDFVVDLIDTLKPENMISRMSHLSPAQVSNFVRFVTLPVPLLNVIQKDIKKDHTISIYCVRVLVKMLQTLKRYMQILAMDESQGLIDLRNKLEYFIPKHMPTPNEIVSLIADVIKNKEDVKTTESYILPQIDKTDSLRYLIELLLLYNDIQPAFFETLEDSIDMKSILDYAMTLKTGNTALLKFKIVSLWLTLDNTATSVKSPIFKQLFLIMLEVFTSADDDTWIEAKDTLYNFFRNTYIFEADEDEIHLVLYLLRNTKVSPITLIGDIVEYVLINIKELTEVVRNQLVNFEFSNESCEVELDKLFNDLMEGKNTNENMFLECRTPTPFIVGCMQFIQENKLAKKNLKQFSSLYVANLLHNNYTPELAEVLIGDTKLDVREYVTSWISEPVALPDSMVNSENTLHALSKSIIGNEDVPINKIFTFLEEVEQEVSAFTINDVHYKCNMEKNVDSSELLIWSKYLIFCSVRLTNMGRLQEEQQRKITNYFHLLISVARKHHLIDICRSIILSAFKNPHFLKIYKPLYLKGDDNSLLATNFLIDVMESHPDIIKYLDKKYKILKSYEQKNFNELNKVFVKINKRNDMNCEHTINVLEKVGLSKEDDLNIFSKIFNSDVNCCVKDDKEPSVVLRILQVLLNKYSMSLSLELPEHVLRKSMKLYSELLINKEINVNLTDLEDTFVRYIQNKPYTVSHLTEDIFRKFFQANNIRKSTSALASLLLRFSSKFCNIFKEEASKPEILGQRELTLPLGNAALYHKQFVVENKEFLSKIFNEYKTNITKLIEKPHKAGQVYVANSELIQKLVMECMDTQDCRKIFRKSPKYETVDLSHVKLLETIFLKMCLTEEGHKKEYFINYLLSLLHLTSLALKENMDASILVTITSSISGVMQFCKSIAGFNLEQKEDFQKVTESAIWQNFCKNVLKDSLKVSKMSQQTSGPQLLFLLGTLVKLVYPVDHQDIALLFDMVTSHSEFLNVMLSFHSSDIKSCLINFLYTLVQINKSVIKLQQVPVYLSAYHATRSACDRLILSILYYYETSGQPVNEYKPYVFGDSAANHYAVRKSKSSTLWGHPTANRVLNLFDKDTIERTVRSFPVTQKLEYHYELPSNINDSYSVLDESLKDAIVNISKQDVFKAKPSKDNEGAIKAMAMKRIYETIVDRTKDDLSSVSHIESDDSVYDPAFLFPLLSHLLAPGSMASCFKILRSGLLSVPVVALSSVCPSMRAAAYHVLHRFCMLLETETKHKNNKLFLTDFITTLRHSLSAIANAPEDGPFDIRNPRIPAIDAMYLARALMVSTAPSDPLYKVVNNFFIAKQSVDLTLVPDFLNLFHDTDVESAERRHWILDVMREGTKTMTDVNVIFKTMCLKMIMDFYFSVLSDRKAQVKILGVLTSLVSIPRAFEILIEGYGLFAWLHSVVNCLNKDKSLIVEIIVLIKTMLYSTIVNGCIKSAKTERIELKLNKDIENKIANIMYDLLQHTNSLDVNDLVSYVGAYSLLSKRAVKMFSKKQMLILVNRCTFVKDSESVKVLEKALGANDVTLLFSKSIVNIDSVERCLVKELTGVVRDYIM